jgi:hypothetical protein
MALIRSRLGRLVTAIGVGLVVEILLLAGGTVVGSRFQQPWDERVWAATQEPAYHLVDWLARVHRPGFEEQGAYFVLIPLSQWLMWSAVSYLFLSRKKRNPVTVTVE